MMRLQALAGIALICGLAWMLGGCRRGVRPRFVAAGLAATLLAAAALLHLPALRAVFTAIGQGVDALATATRAGTSLVFGFLGGAPLPFVETAPGASFVLFFQALPLVLVVGALAALLTHWGVIGVLIGALAAALRRIFGLSGAATLSVAANVFVGMVEAPLLIRPWLARLTEAELFVVMVAGLATISGNMLVVYATMLAGVRPDAAGQLLAASLVAAPASVLVAGLARPAEPAAAAEPPVRLPRIYQGSFDALLRGTADGLSLLLSIMAALIVFVALVALVDLALAPLLGLSLRDAGAVLLWPLAWAMGVPAEEAAAAARLLAVKLVVNEFVAYLELPAAALSERSRLIMIWALCGFTNFASLGILLTGLTTLVPERRADVLRLGVPSLAAATLACCLVGAAVGVLA